MMQFISLIPLALTSQMPVITEVAANPLYETSGEFVEIYNPSEVPISMSGFSLTDGDALDGIVAWDESVFGPFPQTGMLLGTDTLPAGGFALVFELDYPENPVYDIPSGTLILTTADQSICNGIAASSDPLTLFEPGGSADSNAVSTWGTPVPSDIWQERDDDGVDDIPFDPGEEHTVERYPWWSPDGDGFWIIGPEGGTPGVHAQAPADTLNISCDSIWTCPSAPPDGVPFEILAVFTCWGNTSPSSGSLTIFLDTQGDSIASPGEILLEFPASGMQPGTSDTLSVITSLDSGWYLPCAIASVQEDEYPEDDFSSCILVVGGGIDPVVTEVMCNPINEDFGEYIEVFYPGPGIFPMTSGSFTDGDALDVIALWEGEPLNDPDALYGSFLPADRFGLIMDPEYILGAQPYDLGESTFVFTVGNTTIGNGLTSNDPITLYDPFGTMQTNVLSTYGTPLLNDDPLLCDDDGLDGIPYDPGEHHSVERRWYDLPDTEFSWITSPEGGTPGSPCQSVDTTDAAMDTLTIYPQEPETGEPVFLTAFVRNCGTLPFYGAEVTIFLDMNADSIPQTGEVVFFGYTDSLFPGETDSITAVITAPPKGFYLAAAVVEYSEDTNPSNNISCTMFASSGGVFPVVSEVLCNPALEDNDEFIELWYPGPGVFDILGCRFTDGDALDDILPWSDEYGEIQDPDAVSSRYIPEGCFAVILDREYTQGFQPYDLPQETRILTTGNTTLGNGLSGNDPISLYSFSGTASEDVVSTYGTPVDSDDPLLRDDDGLDDIPFDPGEDNSVHRRELSGPDEQSNWISSPEGPTPGGPPPFIVEGVNASCCQLDCCPPMGQGNQDVLLLAELTNTGTDTIPSGELTVNFYLDADCSGYPAEDELIGNWVCEVLPPGDSLLAECTWSSSQGEMLLFAVASCLQDSVPLDDTTSCLWNMTCTVVINEIMYSPSPGEPEWVELVNTSNTETVMWGWTFEDSEEQVPLSSDSIVLQPDGFAIIVPDSSEFFELWGDPGCPVLQPPDWPTLNNNTQQGENWADLLTLRNQSGQAVDHVPYDDDWGGSSGRSLEKLQPQLQGFIMENWTGCQCGGTPGLENSCCSQTGEGRYLEYHPDPFSPDGDGRDDVLTILMNFDHPNNQVTLQVFNIQGRVVRVLLSSENCGSSRTVFWDGTGEGGSRLPIGRYIIHLGSRASETGEYREDCGVVVLARPL